MLDKKGNNVLDRKVNHKLGRGTLFYGDSVLGALRILNFAVL